MTPHASTTIELEINAGVMELPDTTVFDNGWPDAIEDELQTAAAQVVDMLGAVQFGLRPQSRSQLADFQTQQAHPSIVTHQKGNLSEPVGHFVPPVQARPRN